MPGNRHVNWFPVIWTPDVTGTPVPFNLTGVQSVDIDFRGNIITHMGDADAFATMKSLANSDPMMTVRLRDLPALHGLPPGSRGTLAGTHRDARNAAAAGGGGYVATMAHGIVEGNTSGGTYAAYGEGSLMVSGESPDGVVSPLVFAAL